MVLKEGGIYSNGKKICRKIIKFDGDHVVYAKCYYTSHRGMYVIGAGIHLNKKILKSSFMNWVRDGFDDMGHVLCTNCHVVLHGEEKNKTLQNCDDCYMELYDTAVGECTVV